MNSKSFFAVGMLTAAVSALDLGWNLDDYKYSSAPRVKLTGPAYTTIPSYTAEEVVDEGLQTIDPDSVSQSDEAPVV